MFISNLHNMHAFMYIYCISTLYHLYVFPTSPFSTYIHTFQEESKTMLDEDD